jgi:hypothetical protein
MISKEAILKMVKKRGDVGDVIPAPVGNKPNPLLAARFLSKQEQKNLIQWRLGRVAFHQVCLKCFMQDEYVELSRQHGVECSGMSAEIATRFSHISEDSGNILDAALNNVEMNETALEDIQFLSKCIETIRQNCLKWQYNEDGILIGPTTSQV